MCIILCVFHKTVPKAHLTPTKQSGGGGVFIGAFDRSPKEKNLFCRPKNMPSSLKNFIFQLNIILIKFPPPPAPSPNSLMYREPKTI